MVSLMSTPTNCCPQSQLTQQDWQAMSSVQASPTSTSEYPALGIDPACTGYPCPLNVPSPFCSTMNVPLRLAEKGQLGVYFGSSINGTLIVRGIALGAAVHCWNRQCLLAGLANQSRCIAIGDVILSVNGKTHWRDMLEECEEQLLLKMVFARVDPWLAFGGSFQQ